MCFPVYFKMDLFFYIFFCESCSWFVHIEMNRVFICVNVCVPVIDIYFCGFLLCYLKFLFSTSISGLVALGMKCSHFASILIWPLGDLHVGRLVVVQPSMDVPIPYQCHGNISDTITCASYPLHSVILHGFLNVSTNFHALWKKNWIETIRELSDFSSDGPKIWKISNFNWNWISIFVSFENNFFLHAFG